MQWLPDQRNSRMTAILLLVIALLLVYLLVFHWFFMRHREYADELSDLKEQLARFEAVVAQREALQQQLAAVREARDDAELFLSEPDFNEAAAAMSDRLGQMVQNLADEDCQIISRQPVRPRVQERYERVTVNVRMRCGAEPMLEVLYRLEAEVPMVIVEDLNIVRPRSRSRRGEEASLVEALDVRFNMSGYLRS